MLPVPLNSSKITSSMRDPVSISAVATIVSEPPPSMLRALPKNRFGFCMRAGVHAAREDLPAVRHHRVVRAREARDRVEQDHHVLAVLDEPLRLLDHHLGDLHVPARGFVEGRADDLGLRHLRLEVGDFLGPLVDEQHDQRDLGMILDDRVRHLLQQDRLAGARRRDDQAALSLADGGDAGRSRASRDRRACDSRRRRRSG